MLQVTTELACAAVAQRLTRIVLVSAVDHLLTLLQRSIEANLHTLAKFVIARAQGRYLLACFVQVVRGVPPALVHPRQAHRCLSAILPVPSHAAAA